MTVNVKCRILVSSANGLLWLLLILLQLQAMLSWFCLCRWLLSEWSFISFELSLNRRSATTWVASTRAGAGVGGIKSYPVTGLWVPPEKGRSFSHLLLDYWALIGQSSLWLHSVWMLSGWRRVTLLSAIHCSVMVFFYKSWHRKSLQRWRCMMFIYSGMSDQPPARREVRHDWNDFDTQFIQGF